MEASIFDISCGRGCVVSLSWAWDQDDLFASAPSLPWLFNYVENDISKETTAQFVILYVSAYKKLIVSDYAKLIS